MNGNACKAVLEKLDDLESEIIKSQHPTVPELLTLVTSLRAFNKGCVVVLWHNESVNVNLRLSFSVWCLLAF